MSSISETGHAKNVGNFDVVVSACIEQGVAYKPSNALLELPAITALNTSAKDILKQTNAAHAAYSKLAGERAAAFEPLSELLTRVVNGIKSCGTTKENIKGATSIIRKIQGPSSSKKKGTKKTKVASDAVVIPQNEISRSQLSFDNRVNNLDALIKKLELIPEYKPNETGLKLATIKTLYDKLDTINSETGRAGLALSNARDERNELLYTLDTGLVDIALGVKSYFISIFGTKSTKYRQISKLIFKRVKN